MKTLRSSLLAMALMTPLTAAAADEFVDTTSASIGGELEVDLRSTAGLGAPLDVTRTASLDLGQPMEVDGRSFDGVTGRTLSPFDGQLADALPKPLPPLAPLDVLAEQVRGMGIDAVDWLAPRVRYRSTLAELPGLTGDEAGATERELLELVQPPFGLVPEPLRSGGKLSEVSVDPVFGLPRYARAWKLGTKGTLYAGLSALDGVRDVYARITAEAHASTAPATIRDIRLAGRAAFLATGTTVAVAVAPLDEVYAVIAVIDGTAANDAPFVSALLRSLQETSGLDDDAAIAEALSPGARIHFDFDTGPLDGSIGTALAWQPVLPAVSESSLSALVRSTYGIELSLAALTAVPTPMTAAFAPAGASYALLTPGAQGQPHLLLGQLNVAVAAERPERVAAFIARSLQATPQVGAHDGRYLLTGTWQDASTVHKQVYAYRATLTPLADGTTFVTQSFLHPASQQAVQLHAAGVFDLALPGVAGQTTQPAAGPTLPAMNIAVRRGTRSAQTVSPALASAARTQGGDSTDASDGGFGALSVGYGTGGATLSYEPLMWRGYAVYGVQYGRIVNPEGNSYDGGVDFFGHGRYELPMQFIPHLTTEVSLGLHLGIAGTSAVGVGLRAAANYRLSGPLTAWVALQSQHYPNGEVNGTWLAASVGLGYRSE